MRVIGGEAGGRQLKAPTGRATRPTSDRVREAMFNILQSRVDWVESEVVDLFAGSGALGIEAVSRGAKRAVLVDNDPAAVQVAATNVASLGYDRGERVRTVRADSLRWATSAGPSRDNTVVVFADPPYRWQGWPQFWAALSPWADLVVAESSSPVEPGPGWSIDVARKYGATLVTVALADPSRPDRSRDER